MAALDLESPNDLARVWIGPLHPQSAVLTSILVFNRKLQRRTIAVPLNDNSALGGQGPQCSRQRPLSPRNLPLDTYAADKKSDVGIHLKRNPISQDRNSRCIDADRNHCSRLTRSTW